MRDYKVLVTRDVTESAWVTVSALSDDDAHEKAIIGAHDGTLDPQWAIDDDSCGKSPCYITDTIRCGQSDIVQEKQ